MRTKEGEYSHVNIEQFVDEAQTKVEIRVQFGFWTPAALRVDDDLRGIDRIPRYQYLIFQAQDSEGRREGVPTLPYGDRRRTVGLKATQEWKWKGVCL